MNIEKNKCAEGRESKNGRREFLASSLLTTHTHTFHYDWQLFFSTWNERRPPGRRRRRRGRTVCKEWRSKKKRNWLRCLPSLSFFFFSSQSGCELVRSLAVFLFARSNQTDTEQLRALTTTTRTRTQRKWNLFSSFSFLHRVSTVDSVS